MTEPHFRTLVTFEVITTKEAFGTDWDMLQDAESVACIDRQEPQELTPAIAQRITELHNAAGNGWNIEAASPRTDVLAEVLLEMDQTDGNLGAEATADDYRYDLLWRLARQHYGDAVRIIKGDDK